MSATRRMDVVIGKSTWAVELNASRTADELWAALPLRGDGDFWGEEIYFGVGVALSEDHPKADVEVGDVAYWRPGKALCLFFGPTPASVDERPRAASPVTMVGRLVGDPRGLAKAHDLRGIVARAWTRD